MTADISFKANLVEIGLISCELSVVMMTTIIVWKLGKSLYKIDFTYFKWFWWIDGLYIFFCLFSTYIDASGTTLDRSNASFLQTGEDIWDIAQSFVCYLTLIHTDYNFPFERVIKKVKYPLISFSVLLLTAAVLRPVLFPALPVRVLTIIRICYNLVAFFNIAFYLKQMTIKFRSIPNFLFYGMILYTLTQLIGLKMVFLTSNSAHDSVLGWSLGLLSKSLIFWGLLQIFKNEALRSVDLEKLLFRTFHELQNNLYGISTPVKKIMLPNWRERKIDPRTEATEIDKTYEVLRSIIEGSIYVYKSALYDSSSDKVLERELTHMLESKKEEVRLNTLVDVAIRLVKKFTKEGFRVQCDYGGGCIIMCHKHQIIQVFVNILKNASEAFPDGEGDVMITTRNKLTDQSGEHKFVNITFDDNGPGIPPELMDKIFVEGFSTKGREGRGMGLPIIKDIIENGYGNLQVKSPIHEAPSKTPGTRFIIIFNH